MPTPNQPRTRTALWTKTHEGYSIEPYGARLYRSGRDWRLSVDGAEYSLGRKATFPVAERALAEHLAKVAA